MSITKLKVEVSIVKLKYLELAHLQQWVVVTFDCHYIEDDFNIKVI